MKKYIAVALVLGGSWAATAQTSVWTQFPNTPAGIARNDDIYFADQQNGWSARGTDGVYRTINGGQTWIKVIPNTSPIAHFRCIGFASTTHGWTGNLGPGSYDGLVNDTNMLYETFDGGSNWNAVASINASGMQGFCAIHVMDAQHIYGAGRVRGDAYFAKSENGGTNWSVINLKTAGVMGGLMDVYFKDPTNGFVVGMDTNSFYAPPYYGSIARTTNGGSSWQVLVTTPVASSYFWKMSWPSPNIGYASLQQNSSYSTVIYYKTTDGGATWVSNGIPLTAIGSPSSFGLQGIGFINDNEGWMGGTTVLNPPYSFIHTTNGGLNWTSEGYNNTRSINRIRFASPTLGYMSGQTLHFYHVPLAINVSPTNKTVAFQSNVTFNVSAYGTAPLVYQWQFNGTALPNTNTNIYSIASVQATSSGNYDVVVRDFSGSVTSAIGTLTVTGVPIPPTITNQPQSLMINLGSNAMFTVGAIGTAPLAYQWQFNGGNISGATNTTYTRTNTQPADAGGYTVQVTNISGSVTSAEAGLSFRFVDDFDQYPSPVIVTSSGTNNGYKILFGAVSGPQDFKVIFGFDYSTITFPTNIPTAPHSSGGTTKGLFMAVNKDATGAAAAVNLYPLGLLAAGNFALKFDLWLNWTNPGSATEHALFGINHSGNVTNRVSQATSDGLFFAVDGDGNVSATSAPIRDYSAFHGGGAGAAPILMLPNNTTFGPTPPLGLQFDNTNAGFMNLFPSKNIPGYPTTPAGTPGLGWVSGEVRQLNNLITCLLNGVAIAQYTNTYGYTNGSVMIGYNDVFDSLGSTNNFVIFDNLRVETIAPVKLLSPYLAGNNFGFSFATEPYDSYTVQSATDLTAPNWVSYTNFIGSGSPYNAVASLTNRLTQQYFRVSQP